MAENRLQYTVRNYDDIRNSLIDITRTYYGNIYASLNDASIGQWMIDINSDIYDAIMYNIDRAYQETDIDTASKRSSLLAMARSLGVKVPGPKSAIVEIEISCDIPRNNSLSEYNSNNLALADEDYCPVIRRGSIFTDGRTIFELMEDVDFKEQFDSNGISNRVIVPLRTSNGEVVSYRYKKLSIASAGQSKVYKRFISSSDIEPFMNITLKDANILGVESIILKQGKSLTDDPNIADFYVDRESYEDTKGRPTLRFFEVDNLVDQYRFGYEEEECDVETLDDGRKVVKYYSPTWEVTEVAEVTTDDGSTEVIPLRQAVKGKWKRLKNKFVTEFTDNGNLKITFGSGLRNQYGTIPNDAREYTKYLMSHMEANDYMGVLPEQNTTLYVLYRVGGGEMSNVGANTVKSIVSMSAQIAGNCSPLNTQDSTIKANVRNSIKVTNPTPSYGGKDAPSDEEMRFMIKYISSAQNRCVTVGDYYARLLQMPAKYGVPFRCGVSEENNKIVVYSLGLDYQGKLMSALSETVAENMKTYLSKYRMVNDYVEIRSGRIVNLAFEIDLFVGADYDKGEVSKRVIELTKEYMDIRAHQMGEDIFVGDLEKEISKLDGVVNLIELRCYNKVGNGYSETEITQPLVETETPGYENRRIDLMATDKILFSDFGSMFEVKYPDSGDIRVNVKVR
ncbi:MAG: hypothetical protein J6X18_15475 [Bacteroidales bacterium]|nr:hypothetical protein [Bacteroidales bacterium]